MIAGSEVGAFFLATVGESINPGPTLAALVLARIRGWKEAWGVVIGVAFANMAWIAIVFLLKDFASQYSSHFKVFGAFVLVLFATRALAPAVISVIEASIQKKWTPLEKDTTDAARSLVDGVTKGFLVHLFNPLSITYYLGAYGGTVASDTVLAFKFSMIAVLVDFAIYGVIASISIGRFLKNAPKTFLVQRALALLSGFAMLFLVAHVFAIGRGDELHGLRNLFILLGFLVGAIWVAEEFANKYRGGKNKLLWRGLLVWQSAFGALAITGAFFSVLARDPKSVEVLPLWISEIAVCSLVAAIVAVTLSYARARGELLDEIKSSGGDKKNSRTSLINGPKFVFPLTLGCLTLLFVFFFFFSSFSR